MRRNDSVIYPGDCRMDRDFTFYVARVDRIRRRFWVNAGLLSGWRQMRHYRWDPMSSRWIHEDLPLNINA